MIGDGGFPGDMPILVTNTSKYGKMLDANKLSLTCDSVRSTLRRKRLLRSCVMVPNSMTLLGNIQRTRPDKVSMEILLLVIFLRLIPFHA